MRKIYDISSRNRKHHFVSVNNDGGNPYYLEPQESWMPLYLTYNDDGTIFAVDTDGGPFIVSGWSNDEVTVDKIEGNGFKPLFYLKENE